MQIVNAGVFWRVKNVTFGPILRIFNNIFTNGQIDFGRKPEL